MLAERKGIDERLGSELADGYCGSAVHALGAVSVSERDADAFYRVRYALDHKAYPEALEAVLSICRRMGASRNWNLKTRYADMAKSVLDYFISDICLSCTGLGAQTILGTPVLGDACPSCGGSGKQRYPWIEERRAHVEVLIALEKADRRVRNKLIDKLAHQIRDSGALK